MMSIRRMAGSDVQYVHLRHAGSLSRVPYVSFSGTDGASCGSKKLQNHALYLKRSDENVFSPRFSFSFWAF
jgi:hypothetical protein